MILAIVLALILVPTDLAAAPLPAAGVSTTHIVHLPSAEGSALEQQYALWNLVNQARNQAGLSPLAWDSSLADAAEEHAQMMASQGTISHQFTGEPALLERLTAHNARLDRASENAVYDITVEGAHDNFMSSAPHRANLLDPSFDAIGIGVVENGGILYIVEDFSHRMVDVPDEQAAQMAAASFEALRRQTGGDELSLVPDVRLQRMAQTMAEHEMPNSSAALALPGARLAASYATLDPANLPPSVAHLTALRGVTHFSVGAHYARGPKYPSGLYWVTIVLFNSPELKSARVR